MLAFQAPPLSRQGQMLMSVETKKYVAVTGLEPVDAFRTKI